MNEDEQFVIPSDGTPPPDKAHELAQNIVPGPGLTATPAHPLFQHMMGGSYQPVVVTEAEVERAQNPEPIVDALPGGQRPTLTAAALGEDAPGITVIPESPEAQAEEVTAEVTATTTGATTPVAKPKNGAK
jgi:hypothetical protein